MDLIGITLVGLLTLTTLGVIVAFSPILVVTELTVLTRSKQPARHIVAFILGIATAIGLLLFIAITSIFSIDPGYVIVLPSVHEIIRAAPLADLLIGILLLVTGIRMYRTKVSAKNSAPSSDKSPGTKSLFWFGFLKMVTSLSSITAILLATRLIKTSVPEGTIQWIAVVWLIGISLLPFIVIAVLQNRKPASFAKIQRVSDKATLVNWRSVIALAFCIIGACFAVSGIMNLQ